MLCSPSLKITQATASYLACGHVHKATLEAYHLEWLYWHNLLKHSSAALAFIPMAHVSELVTINTVCISAVDVNNKRGDVIEWLTSLFVLMQGKYKCHLGSASQSVDRERERERDRERQGERERSSGLEEGAGELPQGLDSNSLSLCVCVSLCVSLVNCVWLCMSN